MIQTQQLSYAIGNKTILEDVSISFQPGKLHLIIGPNGAGKSTLVKLISGQIIASKGTIHYDSKILKTLSITELAKIRAVLSQNIELAFPLKVAEVVMMGRYPHFTSKPKAKDEQACQEAMEFFDVSNLAHRDYMTLSGGEKQRVHFARVTAQIWYPIENYCRHLILDEPLTFLDVHYQFHFMHKLIELLKQKDIIVIGVVHDLNLAAKFANQILLLHQGKVLANGSPNDVLTKQNIKKAYQLEPVFYKTEKTTYLFFE
ncbi:heme ABC transporter ATP-binding protein [Bizionia arctica]|uniref:Hemin import ATP-binding protein HmuV n=1 Tax=Bizionia arctica TaxID=1495645 RepID=A0A917GH08_9FLAO|nr:heme ABC transporter ATP-binding protein [Bizionia arctica]GGG45846.1 hemin import ATP-binding protein HmuV [Bizionia arctica]